ncbi:MAG: pilus assembly protein PilM [Pirellulaceae bacterium]
MMERLELDKALHTLTHLASQTHPKSEEIRATAQQLIPEVAAERNRHKQSATVHFQRARIMFDECRFGEALHELRKIPEPMRDKPAGELLERCAAVVEEIDNLKQTLVQSQGIAFTARMTALRRLLDLQPEDPKVKRWASQIHDQTLAIAQERINNQRYPQAAQLLRDVPESIHGNDFKKLLRHVNELEYLESELQLAPTVNPVSLEAGRRLARIDKSHEGARKAVREMSERLRAARNQPRTANTEWAACPRHPHVGCPVHALWFPQRLQLAGPEIEKEFQEHPGQFFVACGLALQALGRAAVTLDLMPAGKKGIWDLLHTNIRDAPPKSAWGLDLSNTSLKAVQLTVDDDKKVRVTQCRHLAHPLNLAHPDAADSGKGILLKTLEAFSAEHAIKSTERVATQWPAVRSLVRYPTVLRASGRKLRGLLQQEARYQIPFPLPDVCWDSFVFPESEPVSLKCQVLLLAARAQDVKERVELFREADIQINLVQCDALALHNFLRYDVTRDNSAADGAMASESGAGIGALDVGSDAAGIVFSFPDFVWFRAFRPAGDDLATALSRRFKTTAEVAEQVKRDPTKAKRMSDVHEEFCVLFRKMASQFESAATELNGLAPHKKVHKLLIAGGAGQTHGLLRFFRFGR